MVPGRKRFWGNGLELSARLGLGLLLLSLLPPPAAGDEAQRRFLLVYSAHSTLVANAEATAGMAAAFDRALAAGYEVYAEYRDDQRFPGLDADRAFAEEMQRKYAGRDFDAILAFGRTALDYALAHRGALGMSAPVVFGGVTDGTLAGIDLPADVHGVSSRYSVAGTLALARRLQPDARCAPRGRRRPASRPASPASPRASARCSTWWSRAGSTSRSPPTSASRKRPSRSTAPASCTSSMRAPSPTSCAWRSAAAPDGGHWTRGQLSPSARRPYLVIPA